MATEAGRKYATEKFISALSLRCFWTECDLANGPSSLVCVAAISNSNITYLKHKRTT